MLGKSVFKQDNVVIGWDVKQLFSYLKYNLPPHWRIPNYCHFVDLKLGEAFLGVFRDCPYTFDEAVKRTSLLMNNPQWVKINQSVFTPLITDVIPGIESVGITNRSAGRRQHVCYFIEGQANGRMNTKVVCDNFFNPHNLSDEQKKEFSAGHEKKFLVFDYKSMEVGVLEWLTKDERLGEIIRSGEDVYSAIYCVVSGSNKCSEANRKLIKKVFLPVVYGCQAKQLAEDLGISVGGASSLIETINEKFATALDWVKSHQDRLKQSSVVKDRFGRVMDFGEGSNRKPWSVRNAVVQGPAALICLEKLIQLYQQKSPSMDVVASIYDGFVCTVDSRCWESVAVHAKEVLESPSQLAPDCVLRVGIGVGEDWGKLDEMK